MPHIGINTFKAQLTGGGARPNLFRVILTFPALSGATASAAKASIMTKGASLPASTLGVVAVPFQGKVLNVAGDRTYEPWSLTVINDTDFVPYDAFTDWMAMISDHESGAGTQNPNLYDQDLEVHQLDKNGSVLKKFFIQGAWPSSVGAIEVSNDSADTIEEFTVELQMAYWIKSV